jgi:hypothetical protein
VELRDLAVLPADHRHAQADLHEDGDLDDRGEPPQRTRPQRRDAMGRQRPRAGQPVADDDDPRPGGVDVEQ